MLEILDKEYFDEVVEFATNNNRYDQLKERLDYLSTYADHNNEGKTKCKLGPDFAPQSFYFTMYHKNKNGEFDYWFNGGLIFHGTHDNGGDGSSPTLSVCLSPTDGWSIHT